MNLSLPHENVSITKLLPRVQAAIEGIDPNLAAEYLMSAAIEFCSDTDVIRKTFCIPIKPCVTSYPIKTEPYIISKVVGVHTDTDDTCLSNTKIDDFVYVDNNTVYLDIEPSEQMEGMKLNIEVSLKPDRLGDLIPKELYQDWESAIVSLALSNLYIDMPDIKGAVTRSNLKKRDYLDYVTKAVAKNMTKHRAITVKLTPKWNPRK